MKNEIFISFHENFDPHMIRYHFVYTLILSSFQRSKVGCCILVKETQKPSEIASICKFCADLCRIDGRIVGDVASLYKINDLENHSINIKKMAENCQKLKILHRENYTHKNKIEVPKIGKKVGGQWAVVVSICILQI